MSDTLKTVRTRFAPSPTGYMHIGNLRSALYTWLYARHHGGRFILRIEDTDQNRYVEGATEVIYRTLKSIGMDWDEGPDVGGEYGPYVQSERKNMYLPYAQRLVEMGKAYYASAPMRSWTAAGRPQPTGEKPLSMTSTACTFPRRRSTGGLPRANRMLYAKTCRSRARPALTTPYTAT